MRIDEYDQLMAKRVQTGGSPHIRGTENKHESRCKRDTSQFGCTFVDKRTVFGCPDVVIRLAHKTRLVGRRVVTAVVSSSPPPSLQVLVVTVVVGVDEPVAYRRNYSRN